MFYTSSFRACMVELKVFEHYKKCVRYPAGDTFPADARSGRGRTRDSSRDLPMEAKNRNQTQYLQIK